MAENKRIRRHHMEVCPPWAKPCERCQKIWRTCHACGGRGDSLPAHCPERLMTEAQKRAVTEGRMNFSAGKWREYDPPQRRGTGLNCVPVEACAPDAPRAAP
jgi:hypothetical protein